MAFHDTKHESERPNWPNKLDFNFSILSYAIGLIAFWRFPYLAYENAGAPFLYTFLLLYILIGIPIVFLEMAWGQYGNLAALQAFRVVPVMQGIGICMLFFSCSLIIYFGCASYYFLLYLTSSFSTIQPWTTCDNTWNSELCYVTPACNDSKGIQSSQDFSKRDGVDENGCFSSNESYVTPALEFWTKNLEFQDNVCTLHPDISQILNGLNSSNVILTPIILLTCFAAAKLVLCVIAMAYDVRITGKVAGFATLTTFATITALLVRSVTLEGSMNGIMDLFLPRDLKAFTSPKVWKDASSQVLLSVIASSGGLITWSSYNRFYNKYQVDASILIVAVPIFSLMSAVSVFSVAGYLAYPFNGDPLMALQQVKGPVAPLVAYSEAVAHMWGGSTPWGIAVFVTLFLSSSMTVLPHAECILSSLTDAFPLLRHLLLRNLIATILLLAFIATYLGVPCFLSGVAMMVFDFFDSFSLALSLMVVAVLEILLIFYSFGYKLLYTNTKAMTRSTCLKSHFWSVLWGGFTPFVLLSCIAYTVYGIISHGVPALAPTTPPGTTSSWNAVAGGVYVGFVFLLLLIVMIIKVALSRGSCSDKFRMAFCTHSSRASGSTVNHSSHRNGNLFLNNYTSHHPGRIEMLIDEDVVTTV